MTVGLALLVAPLAGRLDAAAQNAAAQDVAVPVNVHLPILMKILNFDRNLPPRVQGEIWVGVVYQAGYRVSSRVAADVQASVAALPADILGGFPIRAVPIDLDGVDDLAATLAQQRVRVLYVAPLRGVAIGDIVGASRAARVPTMTGVPEYVADGIGVGIDAKGDRPQIVVNVPASRREGADFSSQLLKLARIVNR